MNWSDPYFTFGVNANVEGEFRVDFPLRNLSYGVDGANAASVVLSFALEDARPKDDEAKTADRRLIGAGIDEWIERGWLGSLTLLMDSLGTEYVDMDDSSGRIRERVLEGYGLEEKQSPSRAPYPGAPIPLPEFGATELSDVRSAVANRRTVRRFSRQSVGFGVLSGLLYRAFGQVKNARSASASAGRLGELVSYGGAFEFYIVAFAVSDLQPGVYRYSPEDHALYMVALGDFRQEVRSILMQQPAPLSCGATLFFVADYEWQMWRYRHSRALLNLYCDAGRLAQRLIVSAMRCGLASFPTPAIKDGAAAQLLNIVDTARWNALYSVSFGCPESP